VSTTATSTPRRPARKYSEQFKAEAVAMVTELGKSVYEVSRSLDISNSLLYGWVKKSRESSGLVNASSDRELAKMKSEIKQLQMENEFLKKAAAFFAKESQ
jgi:transposase